MSVGLAPPRPIAEIDTNSLEFREALATMAEILWQTDISAYTHHQHDVQFGAFAPDEVLFKSPLASGELQLRRVPESWAIQNGKISTWGVTSDGQLVPLQYASYELHENSGFDVMLPQFQADLTRVAGEVAQARLHGLFVLTIVPLLYPTGPSYFTLEVTCGLNDQRLKLIRKDELPTSTNGLRVYPTCWSLGETGEMVSTGWCVKCLDGVHGEPDPEPDPKFRP